MTKKAYAARAQVRDKMQQRPGVIHSQIGIQLHRRACRTDNGYGHTKHDDAVINVAQFELVFRHGIADADVHEQRTNGGNGRIPNAVEYHAEKTCFAEFKFLKRVNIVVENPLFGKAERLTQVDLVQNFVLKAVRYQYAERYEHRKRVHRKQYEHHGK